MLYDPDAKMVHIVNETARDVWNLCDGTRSLEEIATRLLEKYDVEMNVLRSDVRGLIADLERIGLMSNIG